MAELLGVEAADAARLLLACRHLTTAALRLPADSSVASLLPESLDPRLAKILATQVTARLPAWRDAAAAQAPALPRLQRMAWSVSMQSGSDDARRAGVPSAVVEAEVMAQPAARGMLSGTETVQFELSKETLGVFIEGLARIRDQLEALGGSGGSALGPTPSSSS